MAAKSFKHKKITFRKERDFQRSNKDENKKEEGSGSIAFLQPEILPIELMKSLLITRGGGDDIRKEESHKEIIKLFYKHITPKPQRLYRQNRRGKILLRLQRKKEKLKPNNKNEDFKIMQESEHKHPHLTSSLESVSNSQTAEGESNLKRPITCIDPDRKKIKLKSSSSSLDNIQIVKRKKPAEDKLLERKSNKEKDLHKSEKKSTNDANKKIILDRKERSSTASSTSSDKNSKTESTSEPKKKRKLISWP